MKKSFWCFPGADFNEFRKRLIDIVEKSNREVRAIDPKVHQIKLTEEDIVKQWEYELSIREGREREPTMEDVMESITAATRSIKELLTSDDLGDLGKKLLKRNNTIIRRTAKMRKGLRNKKRSN
ncbi:MAG: hypothetical protein COV07_00280 [Candidatus Vogelbacteria bacterium CG10_big_fil_rev_8_21_14_0_10_45_14]|uniref:Uncharacterized protein n=1 Tax=Candidatus Vogelbacteria bacterium CG10_big_fil_rev_8_21_14_0_10_45_14 TaxID=1975042 RepID=A0A2H0RN61_9BACT|nr:MAG: hypothetical protein COV07_00280 [Candidatus Vogelbacteria bacterium CG10_big_fil_rev_8_21_14_0_10_45_14]